MIFGPVSEVLDQAIRYFTLVLCKLIYPSVSTAGRKKSIFELMRHYSPRTNIFIIIGLRKQRIDPPIMVAEYNDI